MLFTFMFLLSVLNQTLSIYFQNKMISKKYFNHVTPSQDLDIEDRILRRREMSHLFQWYYPEGGWGWVILLCSVLTLSLAHGIQWGFPYPVGALVRKRFSLSSGTSPTNTSDVTRDGDRKNVGTFEIGESHFYTRTWHKLLFHTQAPLYSLLKIFQIYNIFEILDLKRVYYSNRNKCTYTC